MGSLSSRERHCSISPFYNIDTYILRDCLVIVLTILIYIFCLFTSLLECEETRSTIDVEHDHCSSL